MKNNKCLIELNLTIAKAYVFVIIIVLTLVFPGFDAAHLVAVSRCM